MKKILRNVVSKTLYKRPNEQKVVSATAPAEAEPSNCLEIIYEGVNPTVDIVAIHGLGGHWKNSWTDSDSGTFWLQDLLPKDVPKTRILSFGYNASRTSTAAMEDVAVALLTLLARLRVDTNALARKEPNENTLPETLITSSTYGICFFGVSQQAHDGLNNLAAFSSDGQDAASESPLMKAYKRDLVWLRESSSAFAEISSDFVIKSFTESSGDRSDSSLLTLQDSSNHLDHNLIPLNKTHGAMIRFAGADDKDYQNVLTVIAKIVAQACNHPKATG